LKHPAVSETEYPSILPDPCHCEMPEQSLWSHRPRQSHTQARTYIARGALFVLWLAASGAFAWTLYRVLSVEMPTMLQLVFLVVSTLCFAWVAAGSVSAIIGFIALWATRRIDTLELPPARVPSQSRTALLFPVYREDAAEVSALIDTTCCDLIAAGAGHRFDVFILSDTQVPSERVVEQSVYAELRARYYGRLQIYVRWRTPNEGRKAGNIRDWIERFGEGYPYFVIFDADSIMSASALLRLVAGMDEGPRVGLIQTVPRLVGGQSLFAHVQQFAAGYYGPVVAAGLAAWHGHGGNYWGHNAIIRTKAFARCAGLPRLSGEPPLGGYILSHDFVEAALMRRGGWEVHMVPSLEGSYEGCPPTLADLIVRDRRWAQGNLQHLRLIGANGLPFLSRLHLAMGALSYIASPLWALTLLVGVILALQAKSATPSYFDSEQSLFPKWPVFDAETALGLFFATVLVVHLPKLLGAIWALRNAEERRRNGGVLRVASGVLLESILSTLIAPLLMVTQTSAVLNILIGRDAGWGAQQRQLGHQASLLQFMSQHRWHFMWGFAGAAVCTAISPAVLAWMSPIIAGLLLAAPLALVTARNSGRLMATLLGTPEERHQPALLREVATHRAQLKATMSCEMAPLGGSNAV
jgi:membrane glycosyltransferase